MNNQVFQQVLNALAERRRQNEKEEARRRDEAVARCPEIGEIMEARRNAVMASVYSAFSAPAEENLAGKVEEWNGRIRQLLCRNGFAADYLDPVFTCPLCGDTGYTGSGKKELCSCARGLYASLMDKESSFEDEQTFERFDLYRFPDDKAVDRKKDAAVLRRQRPWKNVPASLHPRPGAGTRYPGPVRHGQPADPHGAQIGLFPRAGGHGRAV